MIRQDDFERADGGLGSNWVTTLNANTLSISVGGVYNSTGGESDAVWQTDDFGDDQFSEILIRTWYAGWLGVWTRRQLPGAQGYLAIYYSGEVHVYAYSSYWNLLASVSQSCNPADRLRLVASGSNPVRLQAFHNGTQVIDYSDSAYHFTGGQPGHASYSPGIGAVESWAGGDGDGAGITHPTPPCPWRVVPGGMSVQNLRAIDGVTYLDVVSAYNSPTAATIRYLKPTSPAQGMRHRFVHLLPCEANTPATNWGDGMDEARSHSIHNNFNATLLAPNFNSTMWGADHASTPGMRDESFMVLDWVPWVELNFGITGIEEHWLCGFSRSGYAAIDLVLRNPGVFDRAAVFDIPADWTWADLASYNAHGTQANFEDNYQPTQTFITSRAGPFQGSKRIWISQDAVTFPTSVTNFISRLGTAGIRYNKSNTNCTLHRYDAGWLPIGIAAINEMATARRMRVMLGAVPLIFAGVAACENKTMSRRRFMIGRWIA